MQQRPDTRWRPHLITNILYETTQTAFTLGNGEIDLPNYITSKKCIKTLLKNHEGIKLSYYFDMWPKKKENLRCLKFEDFSLFEETHKVNLNA